MPADSYSKPLEAILKGDSRVQFEYYEKESNSFSSNPSKICHISINSPIIEKMDVLLIIYTIVARNNKNVKNDINCPAVASEGETGGPSTMVPLRNAAIRLAAQNQWKCIPIAIGGDLFQGNIVDNYVVSIESLAFGNETIMQLSDAFNTLKNTETSYCRIPIKTNKGEYPVSFIPKDKFVDYLLFFDNTKDDPVYEEALQGANIFQNFQKWLTTNDNPDYTGSEKYEGYGYCLNRLMGKMKEFNLIQDVELNDLSVDKYNNYIEVYQLDSKIKDWDKKKNQSGAGIAALKKYVLYVEFLRNKQKEICYDTKIDDKKYERNRIIFGAPGTGKSYQLNLEKNKLLYDDCNIDESVIDASKYGKYERVTFHPDYSYANFVGTYKPVPTLDDGKETITYEYVPGPFMRIYADALENTSEGKTKPFLLIVEEINRADVAAVFGDVFQLLDRDENGVSEYPIQASEDIKQYLAKRLKKDPKEFASIKLPNNLFIWATMNSADQGVFPMDTAFKRRWDFEYLGINTKENEIAGKTVILGKGTYQRKIEWNCLRKAINDEMSKLNINEDKQLGPYFLSKKVVIPESGNEIDPDKFISTFKNKVLMYLFDDAAKQKRNTIFEGCVKDKNRYSDICDDFDERGISIFCQDIVNNVPILPLKAETKGESTE